MDIVAVLSSILTLIAGIGIFLIACQLMSSNLETASSNKLKQLFSKASKNKWIGVGIGTVGTAAIQSSGATTVMTIGFVNAGIISLTQAATIIYGANIGTTVTAQIVALGMSGANSLSTSVIFSAFAGLGAFISLFSKRSNLKTWGGILTGFGMLFVGLELMSDSMKEFAALEGVKLFLANIGNPLLLVLIGAVFTAIIQSSSVMTSIALAMLVSGLIDLSQGIYITMGSNIGSCIVAIIAGLTSGINAKRTALMHMLFNTAGVIIFLLIALVLSIASGGDLSFGVLFESLTPGAPQVQLAMFHTFFNVTTVLVMMPLTEALVNLVVKMIPNSSVEEKEVNKLNFIDNNMLRTPPLAVVQTKREIIEMSKIAMENYDRAMHAITTLDLSEREVFDKTESRLNFINKELVNFVVKLTGERALSEKDHIYLTTTFRSVRDVERIGDYAVNIMEYADNLIKLRQSFSENARSEITQLNKMVHQLYDKVVKAYSDEDLAALDEANVIEEQIDEYTKMMEDNHIKRMGEGLCNASVGAQYLEMSSNAERIADHLINVAKVIRTYKR
ncbi:MAG: Na/Pi cotransporter family protein [bacterium]|nr:Na/Pi cotransporter family protein [bacterium]MDY2649604.1 Na/Pi cotransporter family protein [Candidatus Egerieousia sp.]MDD7071991.1 Na/Pi cotransporter family protein [bacterium]MDD7236499.1 Na/Pi cotransporter family protein [bacterium]MDY3135034.1 Na/Pi cotransporter family protein [Candidatus Egerieousia sp.]